MPNPPIWWRDFRQDLVYALRTMRKNPGFTLVAAASLALGIGANTAIFSIVNGFMRTLPVREPDRLVVLAAEIKGDETGFGFKLSYPALEEYRKQVDRFSDVFAYSLQIDGLTSDGKTSQFLFSSVTGNYFSALGVTPALGRVFGPGEGENAGSDLPLVLGYSYWQKRFHGDPQVIGRQVRVAGRAATVVGVAAKGFHGMVASGDMQGYTPLRSLIDDRDPPSAQVFTNRTRRWFTVLARLKPGVSLEQARASARVVAHRIEDEFPATDRGIGIRVVPEPLTRPIPLRMVEDLLPVIRFFVLLLAALVLMLACMNVANILLVQATVRQREMAIRAALGSTRGRLIRQMLAESMLLALIGAAAGMILGNWSTNALIGSIDVASDLPFLLDYGFDWQVFTYAMAIAVLTGIVTGIWPALRASRADAGTALHDAGRGHSGGPRLQRLRGLLVVGQVAGSLVLLISAGLFVRNLQNAERADLGFTPDHLLNVRLNPSWAGYDKQATNDFYRELERRVRTWPEVRSASLAFGVPLSYYMAGRIVYIEGRPVVTGEPAPVIGCNFIDAAYFETMQIPILRGRAFRETDTEGAPLVAIVNQTMARRYWPGEDPIGKRFRIRAEDSPLLEVVGVARDSKFVFVFQGSLPYFYIPLAQDDITWRVLQLRTSVPPESLSGRLEREIRSLDPNMPMTDLQTMNRSLAGGQGFLIFRIGAIQAAGMGILGLIIALVGVYGVVSYGAAQRTREIGIRMALGATPRSILGVILRQGVWLVISGIVAGLFGAVALARVLSRILALVSATDPLTFIAVPVLLTVVALWACFIPARRAMRVDPTEALRHE